MGPIETEFILFCLTHLSKHFRGGGHINLESSLLGNFPDLAHDPPYTQGDCEEARTCSGRYRSPGTLRGTLAPGLGGCVYVCVRAHVCICARMHLPGGTAKVYDRSILGSLS